MEDFNYFVDQPKSLSYSGPIMDLRTLLKCTYDKIEMLQNDTAATAEDISVEQDMANRTEKEIRRLEKLAFEVEFGF